MRDVLVSPFELTLQSHSFTSFRTAFESSGGTRWNPWDFWREKLIQATPSERTSGMSVTSGSISLSFIREAYSRILTSMYSHTFSIAAFACSRFW